MGVAMTRLRESTVNRCYNYVYPVFIPCNRCFDWSGCNLCICSSFAQDRLKRSGYKLMGDVGDIVSLEAQTFPYFQLRELKCIENLNV